MPKIFLQKFILFFISIILGCLGREGMVNKVFSYIFKKIGTNMKLAFKNVPFRHNSAFVIQKWLRFKRVITVRLAYIS